MPAVAPDALQRRLGEMALLPQIRRPAFGGEALPEASIARGGLGARARARWESAPRSVEAAFRAGRPVLCSDEGVLAERVADGMAGLHFPAGDAAALAALMARCLAEPALWDRLGGGHPGRAQPGRSGGRLCRPVVRPPGGQPPARTGLPGPPLARPAADRVAHSAAEAAPIFSARCGMREARRGASQRWRRSR